MGYCPSISREGLLMATRRPKPVHQMTSAQFDAMFPVGDEDACKAYLKARRWPDGVHCPRCGNPKVYDLKTRKWHWQCTQCAPGGSTGYRFSIIAGTILARKMPMVAHTIGCKTRVTTLPLLVDALARNGFTNESFAARAVLSAAFAVKPRSLARSAAKEALSLASCSTSPNKPPKLSFVKPFRIRSVCSRPIRAASMTG